MIRVYRKQAYMKIIKMIIDKALKEPDKHLIGGLFNAEGNYTVSKRRLRFTNKDPRLIDLVTNYLDKFRINYHVYRRERKKYSWYTIEIYGQNIHRILPYLDLRHPKWFKLILDSNLRL